MPDRLSNILITLTNAILTVVGFFIVMRIILRLVSANPATPIVGWIYNISAALIYPFVGILPDVNAGIGILDIVALVALIGYLLLGALLSWLFRTLILAVDEVFNHARINNTHYHDIDKDLEEDEEEREYHHKHHSR